MNSKYTLFSLFAIVIGALTATHAYTQVQLPEGMSCSASRMASYGYTHKRMTMAEFAAIVIWQRETERRDPGYGNWHLAQKRKMKCKVYQNSSHFQCLVSAQPCRFDKS